MAKKKPIRAVAIIGPGRVGQALGRLLADAGTPIAYVAARRLVAARRAVRFIRQGIPVALTDPRLLNASDFLMTTSDSVIPEVAKAISQVGQRRDGWSGKVVLHLCGSLPSSILSPLKLKGAAIGSLHPYQTIPSSPAGVRSLRGCYWGIEGDRKAVATAKSLVKLLGGTAFSVRPEEKTLYHLSAFIVCPAVVTLMAKAADLLKQAGVPERISRPMLRQFVSETARNFEDLGGPRALTGPAVRGDSATLRRHVAALKKTAPEFEPVYQSLLKAMLRLAGNPSAKRVRPGKSED